MSYIQKNNFNYCKLFYLVKNGQREFGGSCMKIAFYKIHEKPSNKFFLKQNRGEENNIRRTHTSTRL